MYIVIYIYIRMHLCVYVCTCLHVLYAHTYMHTYLPIYLNPCLHACMHACMPPVYTYVHKRLHCNNGCCVRYNLDVFTWKLVNSMSIPKLLVAPLVLSCFHAYVYTEAASHFICRNEQINSKYLIRQIHILRVYIYIHTYRSKPEHQEQQEDVLALLDAKRSLHSSSYVKALPNEPKRRVTKSIDCICQSVKAFVRLCLHSKPPRCRGTRNGTVMALGIVAHQTIAQALVNSVGQVVWKP